MSHKILKHHGDNTIQDNYSLELMSFTALYNKFYAWEFFFYIMTVWSLDFLYDIIYIYIYI
jgi:hypothetical protein